MNGAWESVAWGEDDPASGFAKDRVDVWLLPAGEEPHAAMRRLLGRMQGKRPQDVVLMSDERGRLVFGDPKFGEFHFSLAHSGGRALFATRFRYGVGIDLEKLRDDVDHDAVVATMFPPSWRIAWRTNRAPDRRAAFFDAWVRFEALAKATGRGIAVADPLAGSEAFTCRRLPEIPGFAAAVASEGRDWELRCRRLEPEGVTREAAAISL